MRRFWVLLSFVALCATTLTVAKAEPVTANAAPQAIAATNPSHTAALADHRGRSDGIEVRPELGLLDKEFQEPVTRPPHPTENGAYRVVLLDGSDRWRSLLLGAPPLFA